MTDPAIRIAGLSKAYRIQQGDAPQPTSLAEAVTTRLRNPLKRAPSETFWALKDIDLEIGRGEVVGVIGRNGAGKSTLLKVLSRITEPTTGRIELFGRIGALLEVGTGFHPELTGRENIFLNGAILGMRRAEIRRQFDAIVDFAGVEKFLDTPVKRYSSGMYVRLAFAVAAHLNPEILIVDEVLAVGDAEFQKKCLGKMHDVAQSGRTVLFVSHNMGAIGRLCNRAVLLDRGTIAHTGQVNEVLVRYSNALHANADATVRRAQAIKSVVCIDPATGVAITACKPLSSIAIRITYEHNEPMSAAHFGVCFQSAEGVRALWIRNDHGGNPKLTLPARGELKCTVPSFPLATGLYKIVVGCGDQGVQIDYYESDTLLSVEDQSSDAVYPTFEESAAFSESRWDIRSGE